MRSSRTCRTSSCAGERSCSGSGGRRETGSTSLFLTGGSMISTGFETTDPMTQTRPAVIQGGPMWRKAALLLALVSSSPNEKLQGRWNLTVEMPDGPAPSWIEIEKSGNDVLVG